MSAHAAGQEARETDAPLLEVEGLEVTYGTGRHRRVVVSDVTFSVRRGETVGLVGESGSGKTTIGRSLLGLVKPSAGLVRINGRDATDRRGRRALVRERQAVFQDPFSSLNPSIKVGGSLCEAARVTGMSTAESRSRMGDLLERVGLRASDADRYPSSFSGGQRQRLAVARALMVSPAMLVCDEPVSALDVSVQAQILNLLREVQEEFALGYLFIGHDLDVVAFMAERMLVLQNGSIVERGSVDEVLSAPQHPYTRELIAAANPARATTHNP